MVGVCVCVCVRVVMNSADLQTESSRDQSGWLQKGEGLKSMNCGKETSTNHQLHHAHTTEYPPMGAVNQFPTEHHHCSGLQ